MQLSQFLESLSQLHSTISKDVWPHGATLKCKKCGRTMKASTKQCSQYLRQGWPKCHATTMTVEKEA